ncbi:MAG: GT2 family glycosyltransferase [Bacteroidia bacterium]|jgi:GT2 family glycosyltransferase
MRVAVVILNWNGRLFLEKFLQSAFQNSPQANLYVADNASTDDSLEFVRNHFPTVKLINNGENLGFAGGYNKALSELTEEYFVLLNSDVEVSENWLAPLIELLDSDSKIGACQPKILSYHQKTHFEYAGASGGFLDSYGYPFCRGRLFDTLEEDKGQYQDVSEVFWATGACLFVRNSCYKEQAGLDADFFAHMEEIDFCWRLKRAGYKIMVQPASVVYHVGGGTLPKSNPWKTFLNFRNGLELLVKNLPKSKLIPVLFVRMMLDGVAAVKFLLGGQVGDFVAIFRGHLAFYARLNKTLGKRSGNYDKVGQQFNGSIVYQYFIKGNTKFTSLPSDKL